MPLCILTHSAHTYTKALIHSCCCCYYFLSIHVLSSFLHIDIFHLKSRKINSCSSKWMWMYVCQAIFDSAFLHSVCAFPLACSIHMYWYIYFYTNSESITFLSVLKLSHILMIHHRTRMRHKSCWVCICLRLYGVPWLPVCLCALQCVNVQNNKNEKEYFLFGKKTKNRFDDIGKRLSKLFVYRIFDT